MIDIAQGKSGVTFSLFVQPKASADRIVGEHAGGLKIAVTAAPEAGKANEAVIKLLAKKLGLPRSSISIISGHASRRKTVCIQGIGAEKIIRLTGVAR